MDNKLEGSSDHWLLYFKTLFVDRIMYQLSNSTACTCTLKCTFAQVRLHS